MQFFNYFSLISEILINIALDIGLIDEVSDEIQELEKKLNVYVSQVLSDKERPQSTAQTLSPATIKGESFPLHNNFKSTWLCLQSCQSVQVTSNFVAYRKLVSIYPTLTNNPD